VNSTTDPTAMTATELVAAYVERRLSPLEATEAALARIEAHDAELNAFCLVDPDGAREAARASEQRYLDGAPSGSLDGIPIGVKDLFLTAGWPTLRGSHTVDASGPWEDDAPVTAALRRHGAVLLGKTTTPEWGWKAVTDSPRHGVTRNPWDPTCTPGGSTGGTAAAIAAGMMPLGPGTDGGGSIRIPCSFCGLVGLKPTAGRVPVWPPSPYGTLAHAGPMARTVEDVALLLTALAEADHRDPTAQAPDVRDHRLGLDEGLAEIRVAYSPDLGHVPVDPEVRSVVDAAVRRLADDAGVTLDEVAPGFADPTEIWAVLWSAGAASALRHVEPARREQLDPGLARMIVHGERYSALDYLEAAAERNQLGVVMGRFHTAYDLLVTPTVAVAPFAAGQDVPPGWSSDRWETWAGFSLPFNLTGQPAATVPCGTTSAGLPIGIQVVGARHADHLVLRAAAVLERLHPPAVLPQLDRRAADAG
jgi:aspartyl-tRNA(Asn)/glutamyl-tRNA(Gln) amidotransferase subunit A